MEKIGKLYDQIVLKYIKHFYDDFSDQEELDEFLQRIRPGGQVLDIGCGPGQFSKYCATRGFRVVGVDLSFEMISAAKKLDTLSQYSIMNMRFPSFRKSSFHGLLVAYSFLHIEPKYAETTLLGFRSLLKPKGYLSLMLKEGKGEKKIRGSLNQSLKFYTKLWGVEEIKSLLGTCGYIIESCKIKKPYNKKEYQFNKIIIIARKGEGNGG